MPEGDSGTRFRLADVAPAKQRSHPGNAIISLDHNATIKEALHVRLIEAKRSQLFALTAWHAYTCTCHANQIRVNSHLVSKPDRQAFMLFSL
jgi:hypothetical protein